MTIVSVVVPVYRNASTLLDLYSELLVEFNKHVDLKLELLFVDDGSDDQSLEIIKKLNSEDACVQYLSFDRNYGQVPAIVAGLRCCVGDLAVVMSADLQDPVEMIQEILIRWKAGYEVIICYRTSRDDRWIDRFFSAIFYRLIRIIYPEIPLGGFDFFGLERKAIDEFNSTKNGGKFLQGDVIKLNTRKTFLPYERRARKKGKSQWTFFRKMNYALDALLTENRFVLLISACFFLLGCLFMFISLYKIGYVAFLMFLVSFGIIRSRLKKQHRNPKNGVYYKVVKRS